MKTLEKISDWWWYYIGYKIYYWRLRRETKKFLIRIIYSDID